MNLALLVDQWSFLWQKSSEAVAAANKPNLMSDGRELEW
jgi:hypothetical protein